MPPPAEADPIELLLESLARGDGDARWEAAEQLVEIGRRDARVLAALLETAREEPRPTARRMSLFALRQLAPAHEAAADAMLAALDDPDGDVRRAALACLGRLERPEPRALERALETARAHADPRMRRIAVAILPALALALPTRREPVIRALEALRDDPDPPLGRAVAAALDRLAPAKDAG